MVRVDAVNNGQIQGLNAVPTLLSTLDFKINAKVLACLLLSTVAIATSVTLAVTVSPIALTGLTVAGLALLAGIYFSFARSTALPLSGHQMGFQNPRGDNCSLNAVMQLLKNPRLERIARSNCPAVGYVTQARFEAERNGQSSVRGDAVEKVRGYLTAATQGDIEARGHIDAADSLNQFFRGSVQLSQTINGRPTTSYQASMISLPMGGLDTTFQQKFSRFFKFFTKDYWDHVRNCRGAITQRSMEEAPMDLMIQMQRFIHVQERGRVVGRKLTGDFSVPATIRLPPGSVESAQKNPPEYECQGFIVHEGSLNGGHYYAYRKEGTQWYLCNDAHVKPVSTQEALAQMKQGYVYHFVKIS
ncbi:MAG: ubiquitin carboxyl-terminal hydrolase [Rhabdochlamydiaceae bacterium]|nr:ubiquitin carboxyl-terminal hydrolase [Rhabdochlamydiaceae bacterium]